jgi:hypothetical protein
MGAVGQGLQRPGCSQASDSSHILRCRSVELSKAILPDGGTAPWHVQPRQVGSPPRIRVPR